MHSNTRRVGVPNSVMEEHRTRLREYLARLREIRGDETYSTAESSLHLPFDKDILRRIETVWQATADPRLKYIIVLGIGGSNLGAKAIYDALWGNYDVLEPERYPKIIWADTSDGVLLEKLVHMIKSRTWPEEYLVIYVSKSGATSETALNGSLLWNVFGGEMEKNRWVVISDRNSTLTVEAKKEGLRTLEIPEKVGGRFSVFTTAGLLPLRYLTGNLASLLEGARDMADKCLEDAPGNLALIGASALVHAKEQGFRIHDTFLFQPSLESLGKWYRQLLAESLGKEKDRAGKAVREGILPTVSIGSTDLHSIGQLYLGGPRMSFTSFISLTEPKDSPMPLREETLWEKVVPAIRGKTPQKLMASIRGGVEKAYIGRDLSFIDIQLDSLSLHEIGAFMQWKMIEVMLVGELLNVNAFDQPAVELYKTETRRILDGK